MTNDITPAPIGADAWMDPDTRDVINAERKQSWLDDYGIGGRAKAATYTVPLVRAALAAQQPAVQQGDDFWPVDGKASRKQLIVQIGQMNYRLTALRQENAGLIARTKGQAEALRNYQAAAAPAAQGDALDAERYRLLRRGQRWSVIDGIGDTLRGDELDAAIDAARAAKEGGA